MGKEFKFKSLSDFRKVHNSEYGHLHYRGLLERLCLDMGWEMPRLPRNYWTYDRCKNEALKYTRLQDWRENSSPSYNKAKREGWFDELSKHLTKSFTPIDSWTKETCLEEALKYQIKNEWVKGNNSSYKAAVKNDWVDECTKHMIKFHSPKGYWTKERCHIEALKFDMKERWKKGHNMSYNNARVKGWVSELTTHMIEGCKPRNYWTKEKCHVEALKFGIKENWKKGHPQSYQAARRNGWVDELATHMIEGTKPNGYWTKERCIEHALKFKTISEWTKANSTPATNARKNGWIKECIAHMDISNKPQGHWLVKENVLEEAKKYDTIQDWSRYASASYSQSKKNGWYEECITHMKVQRVRLNSWTKEKCHAEALKYNTRKEWEKNNSNSYRAAKANGWFDELTSHMILLKIKQNYWTKEKCYAEALKYQTRKEWEKNGWSSYNAAKQNYWINECCAHMKVIKGKISIWTLEKCLEYSLNFKTKMEWKNAHSSSFYAAQRNGWYDECVMHMAEINKPKSYWTFERCMEDGKKYNTTNEWRDSNKSGYRYACEHGWLLLVTTHMVKTHKPKGYWTKERCIEHALNFNSITEWNKDCSTVSGVARKNGWFDECTAHMIRKSKPAGYWNKERCLEDAKAYKTTKEWQKNNKTSYNSALRNGWIEEFNAFLIKRKSPKNKL